MQVVEVAAGEQRGSTWKRSKWPPRDPRLVSHAHLQSYPPLTSDPPPVNVNPLTIGHSSAVQEDRSLFQRGKKSTLKSKRLTVTGDACRRKAAAGQDAIRGRRRSRRDSVGEDEDGEDSGSHDGWNGFLLKRGKGAYSRRVIDQHSLYVYVARKTKVGRLILIANTSEDGQKEIKQAAPEALLCTKVWRPRRVKSCTAFVGSSWLLRRLSA